MGTKRKASVAVSAAIDWDAVELESRVCQLICEGKQVPEILAILEAGSPPVQLTRQQPYRILQNAAIKKRIRYQAPIDVELSHALWTRFNWLRSFDVVHTAVLDDVADKAAENQLTMT